MKERLQKILSEYGVSSRRGAEKLIEAGRVQVNGVCAEVGMSADPEQDVITFDGQVLRRKPETVVLMLHKPRGFVTSMHDEQGRHDVSELVADAPERVVPIGRLDRDSEGLLLFTNDGPLCNGLMHPKNRVDKIYEVTVTGLTEQGLSVLRNPLVMQDGYRIQPAEVTVILRNNEHSVLQITIHEGRNRQIRRMCAMAHMKVIRLVRVEESGVKLGNLPAGSWRLLSPDEIQMLRTEAGI